MADGEQSVLVCNQMWPDNFWPVFDWPNNMWPIYCELIYYHNGCVLDYNIDLISATQIDTNLVSSIIIGLEFAPGTILPLNFTDPILSPSLLNLTNINCHLISSYEAQMPLIKFSDHQLSFGSPNIQINLVDASQIILDLVSTLNNPLILIDGYNIYVNFCLSGDCGCE